MSLPTHEWNQKTGGGQHRDYTRNRYHWQGDALSARLRRGPLAALTLVSATLHRLWHIPLASRRSSSREQVNFLYQQENIYVSDNHRVAMWCWLRHLEAGDRVSLFHIDRHSDTLQSNLALWLEALPPLDGLSLADYLRASWHFNGSEVPLIHWGNYLSIFLARYADCLDTLFWSQIPPTGDPPNHAFEDVPPHELPLHLQACADNETPCIVNLDLDYFMWRRQRNDYYQIYSDDYLRHLGQSLAALRQSNALKCLSIALSPECCGGWPNSESLLAKIGDAMGCELRL